MRTSDVCPTCSTFTNSLCVIFDGPLLTTLGINPLDSIDVALNKLDVWASTQVYDLQSVLDIGNYAQSPNTNSYASISLTDVLPITEFYVEESGFWSWLQLNTGNVYLAHGNNSGNDTAISLTPNNISLDVYSPSGNTIVNMLPPTANTTLQFPAKSIGTYTLATTQDYTLQSVLDTGNYAESLATDSWIELNLSEVGSKMFYSRITNGTDNSQIDITAGSANLYSTSSTGESGVELDNENISFYKTINGSGTTTVDFINPTANTTLQFPAKAAGTYILATTEDYTLQSVLNNGNYAESPNADSYLFIGLEDVFPSYDLYLEDGSLWGWQIIQKDYVFQSAGNDITEEYSEIEMSSTNFSLKKYSTVNSTIVNFIEPTANTILQFPTKAAGTYEIATRDKEYTVATLPAGVVGDRAYVTDATAPTYLGALTGGGAVTCPVFHNGTIWVSA